jgi:hypothetical protein
VKPIALDDQHRRAIDLASRAFAERFERVPQGACLIERPDSVCKARRVRQCRLVRIGPRPLDGCRLAALGIGRGCGELCDDCFFGIAAATFFASSTSWRSSAMRVSWSRCDSASATLPSRRTFSSSSARVVREFLDVHLVGALRFSRRIRLSSVICVSADRRSSSECLFAASRSWTSCPCACRRTSAAAASAALAIAVARSSAARAYDIAGERTQVGFEMRAYPVQGTVERFADLIVE